jgi:hypothetical protein
LTDHWSGDTTVRLPRFTPEREAPPENAGPFSFFDLTEMQKNDLILIGHRGLDEREAMTKMMTKEIQKDLPALYSQDGKGYDAVAVVHYFSPWSGWDWYGTEFDGEDTFFGLVKGFETELGYFSLRELSEAKVSIGGVSVPAVERDLHWTPKTLAELVK